MLHYCDGQDGGALGYSDPYQGYGYGLGGIFDVIAAPFKFVATKAVPFVVKTGSRVAQASGLPVISQVGGVVSGLVNRPSPYDPMQGVYSNPPLVSRQTGFRAPAPMYPGTGPVTDFKSQISDILTEIKNAALGGAAQRIAETPQGQAAIRQKIQGDISRYMLPAAAGLVAVLLLTRR